MDLKTKVDSLNNEISSYGNITVVGATKYMNLAKTYDLIKAGIHDIGENRTDIFLEKYEALHKANVRWHFFGVVQSRKVKDVVNKIDVLHSLDKLSTAMELDKRLEKTLDCFVQVNISEEPNKEGIPASRCKAFIKSLSKCENIRIIGLMCIAKNTYDTEVVEKEFERMKKLKEEIESMELSYAPCHELSMGQTNDYKLALKYGATYIRLGRYFLN